ncbi:hypothetical protein MCEL_26840 [Mycolicibacterium celeriflavum]|uniref:Uncharacterized protein n=2 Tax=Mycolicibacterium celeriflavum TaxID=1249101 RepID=A0A7I7RKH1_MYCCF|nr:hypothetical protein MCEL_26840 [Mycolicibacterium celeriflavum]
MDHTFGQIYPMSTDDKQQDDERLTEEQRKAEPETDEHHQVTSEQETPPPTEKPDVTDEHRDKAKEMHKAYEEDRPTTKMPGSGGAVAGTAVNDWIDDEGNPKFSEESSSGQGSEGTGNR